jgi:two-component system response regulator AdeR
MDGALILIVEDDPEIAEILQIFFARDGFRVSFAKDGDAALAHHQMLKPDLVVLDVGLPKLDGFEVLRRIRERGVTPIIMATAMGEDLEKLAALKLGVDDYIVKPFNPLEVVARARAVLRRTLNSANLGGPLRVGMLEVDPESYFVNIVTEDGEKNRLDLTATEFRLIRVMAQAPTRVFSRRELADACLPEIGNAMDRTVDSHISNLRKKLQAAGASDFISVVRGVGYRLSL